MSKPNRIALGVSYVGSHYAGWQSQPSGNTIQDQLERALQAFLASDTQPTTLCAGRTDAGVHGLMQVVHFDTEIERSLTSWVRGTNAYLPIDIAVQWARAVPESFHARAAALSRRYVYKVLESPVRPSIDASRVGWVHRPMDCELIQLAAKHLLGEHDFTSFRAAACQAISPIKTLYKIDISHVGEPMQRYWRFTFEGNAFLHHMIRNIMGCLIAVGQGRQSPDWVKTVLDAKNREIAAPTFAADGLYFLGPTYDAKWGIPERTVGFDFI